MIGEFHFLRPWWLVALLPAVLLVWAAARHDDSGRAWRNLVAPHLLPHLLVGKEEQPWLRPLLLLPVVWLLTVVALAGPTWRREPAPFADDTTVLAIVLKVTPSMLTQDVQPTRLARAVEKIHDLLKTRPGGKTALIAYAGSVHRVMPLTRDAGIIDSFADVLSPEIMPADGNAAGAALRAADDEIVRSGQRGWILLVCDAVAPDQRALLDEHRKAGRAPVSILAVAGEGPELTTVETAATLLDATLVPVAADDRDVRRLASNTRFSTTAAEGGERWQDAGYWLVPAIALLGLFWSRPGWMLRTVARG